MPATVPGGGGSSRRRRARPRPKPPSRQQLARAQAKQIASSERAIPGIARQQRRAAKRARSESRRPVAFRSPRQTNRPFDVQRQRTRREAERADRRIGDNPAIPFFPVLRVYSPRQSKTIHEAYVRAGDQLGLPTSRIYDIASTRQRQNISRVVNRMVESKTLWPALQERRWNRQVDKLPPQLRSSVLEAMRYATEDAVREAIKAGPRAPNRAYHSPEPRPHGLIPAATSTLLAELAERGRIPGLAGGSTTSIWHVARRAAFPLEVTYNLARATAEDPSAVAKASLRTGVESITGIPQAVKHTVDMVEEHGLADGVGMTVEEIAREYERRYGPLLNDPAKFRERVKRDYGLTPFVFDAAAVGAPTGRLAGALAASGPAGRAAIALGRWGGPVGRAGRAGARVHRIALGARDESMVRNLRRDLREAERGGDLERQAAIRRELRRADANAQTRARPALRWSGGEGGVTRQGRSRNLFVGLAQEAADAARRRSWARQVERSGLVEGPGGRLIHPEEGGGSRLSALRPGEREVVPVHTGITGRSLRDLPGLRRYTGRIARDIGGQQSVSRLRMLTRRGRVLDRVDRIIRRLDGHEQQALKYMIQLGARPDENGLAILRHRRDQIIEHREGRGRDGRVVAPILANTNDELVLIERILGEPDKFLTERARTAADELIDIQLREAALDPELTGAQELIRRMTPQGAALGVIRGPDVGYFRAVLRELEDRTETPGLAAYADRLAAEMPDARRGVAREMWRDLRKAVRGRERDVETARRRLAFMSGVIDERKGHVSSAITTPEVTEARRALALARMERDRLVGELKGRRGEHRPVRGVTHGGDYRIADLRVAIEAATAKLRQARENVREAERNAPRVTERQAARLEERRLEVTAAREARDGVRDFEKAFRQVVYASQSKRHMRLEDAGTFAGKVADAAEEFGLSAPGYWWSSIRPDQASRLATVGRGFRAAERSKQYGGELFRLGAEEHGPDVFARGIERNIKRRFQQALIYRNLETHAYEWSRGPGGTGLTPTQIMREIDRRYIDPDSVELIDSRVLTRRPNEPEGMERGSVLSQEALERMTDDDLVTTTQQELAAARRQVRDIQPDELRGQAMHRYVVVPREVGETLDGIANRMDSNFWRGLEIVLKQKPARILLGAANVPWLAFQIASNAMLTGLGGGLNPFNIHGAYKFDQWLKHNDPEAHAAWESEIGITHGHHQLVEQPHLGASSNHFVAFWRAYKHSRVGRLGHKVNPLNFFFRLDEKQNNFFRRVLFHDRARKEAYRRMGSSWQGIDTGISRLVDRVLAKPPDPQLIATHGEDFTNVAKHVRDFLGDYTRFTPSERFLLSRNIMFYGYLRFSLRFAFYTMPIGHPVMTAILANMGQLGAQEIKDLFGVPRNYRLPTSMLAQTYFGSRRDAKRGQLRSLPFGRFNPFLNAVTQMEDAAQSFGLVSPLYQAVADQFFEESSFTGRDWRIEGRPTPSEAERPRSYYGSIWDLLNPSGYSWPGHEGQPRNRILQSSVASLFFPYRVAEGAVLAPNQSDDALLWQPEPMRYKEKEARRGVARTRRERDKLGLSRRIAEGVLPIFPKITAAPQVIEREREKEAEQAARHKGKRRRRATPHRYGGSSSRYG